MSQASWENLATVWDRSLKTLALMPEYSESIDSLSEIKNLMVYTPHKSELEKFKTRSISALSTLPNESFQQILFVPTKNKIESLALINCGIDHLEAAGLFHFACANDSGAKSFMSQLKMLNPDFEFESKRKARFISFSPEQLIHRQDKEWSKDFDYQINQAGFISFPGIYGWNKIDHASRLLLSTLPKLKGEGADFGSGYGFLTHQMDRTLVTKMHLLENDLRALECSRRNLSNETKCIFHWVDILHDRIDLAPLDFIVMNPPFHEGKEVQQDLGLGFIQKAREFLKKDGHLFLVANQFLPYEDALIREFGRMQKVLKQDGFKVLHV